MMVNQNALIADDSDSKDFEMNASRFLDDIDKEFAKMTEKVENIDLSIDVDDEKSLNKAKDELEYVIEGLRRLQVISNLKCIVKHFSNPCSLRLLEHTVVVVTVGRFSNY